MFDSKRSGDLNEYEKALRDRIADHASNLSKSERKDINTEHYIMSIMREYSRIQVRFQSPEPTYYDGMFATQFENCIRSKFDGLDHINEVPSNYVK